MSQQIHWRFFFRVKNEGKARGRIAKVSEAFDTPITPASCERYWKIPELYVCTFAANPAGDSIQERVFNALALANRIGGPWVVKGPLVLDDNQIEFGGELFVSPGKGHSRIPGIEAVFFELLPATQSSASVCGVVDPPPTDH